ncbi:MAG TPA: hypothetical protein VLH08_06290, partial [Acidobacteriota bacterium]|nr:hypothetical protein [Acidobacteriota bacterium]
MTLSDPSVIKLLSTKVIPVWQSLGEVPKVTFELPDGRKLKRTLGGNIVTYLLSPDGNVYDALPGVYTPGDYWSEINKTLAFLKNGKIEPNATQIVEWHRSQ